MKVESSDTLFQEHQLLCKDTVTQLQNREAKNTLSLINNRDTKIFGDFVFLLCKSCFWCASLLDIEEEAVSCPKCKGINVLKMTMYQPIKIMNGGVVG
ncbi:MAG TPA: hypothetical protein VE130_10240 [Nitrososphaeraceae archaeon]|nr:hypothetical protein [Nitrososphaeraceae archaeon]